MGAGYFFVLRQMIPAKARYAMTGHREVVSCRLWSAIRQHLLRGNTMKLNQYVLVLVCMTLVGCAPPTIYRLSISPDDEGVRRELTVVNGDELEPLLREKRSASHEH